MIFQTQPPVGAGIMFLLPVALVVGLVAALIYFIRKNKKLKNQLVALQEYRQQKIEEKR